MSQHDEGNRGDRACKASEASREGEEWTVRGLSSQDDVERSDSISTKSVCGHQTGMIIRYTNRHDNNNNLPALSFLHTFPLRMLVSRWAAFCARCFAFKGPRAPSSQHFTRHFHHDPYSSHPQYIRVIEDKGEILATVGVNYHMKRIKYV
jgi:hypothetical protein